ncbi:hypothetical protein AGDE_13963 [Angomonas deanei]|uniref:Uncharacterized protein n=1 Tax=Angomonas deanei TaxID=59799 RepID=A0A7G2CN74_9TRYP|nr:hypothetical protein AGDE_13963 [Angomonas deanei]CAD2220033.1 hypothetical protein, conserved [Angomonas deanei]|eukprot:EPY21600.1 hypothetical protein AGDE_13963 [Angomonas deanei]
MSETSSNPRESTITFPEEGGHPNNNADREKSVHLFQERITTLLIDDPSEITFTPSSNRKTHLSSEASSSTNHHGNQIKSSTHHAQTAATGGSVRLFKSASHNSSLTKSPTSETNTTAPAARVEDTTTLKPLPNTEFLLASAKGDDNQNNGDHLSQSKGSRAAQDIIFRTQNKNNMSSKGGNAANANNGLEKEKKMLQNVKQHQKELQEFETILKNVEKDAQRTKKKYLQKQSFSAPNRSTHDSDEEAYSKDQALQNIDSEEDEDVFETEENENNAHQTNYLGNVRKYNNNVQLALAEEYYHDRNPPPQSGTAPKDNTVNHSTVTLQDLEKQSALSWTKTRHLLTNQHGGSGNTTKSAFNKDAIRRGIYEYINESEQKLKATRVTRKNKIAKELAHTSNTTHNNNLEKEPNAYFVNSYNNFHFDGEKKEEIDWGNESPSTSQTNPKTDLPSVDSPPESPSLGTAAFPNTANPRSTSDIDAIIHGDDDDAILLFDFNNDERFLHLSESSENVLLSKLLLMANQDHTTNQNHQNTTGGRRRSLSASDTQKLLTSEKQKKKGKHVKSGASKKVKVVPLAPSIGVAEKYNNIIRKEIYENEEKELMAHNFKSKEFQQSYKLLETLKPTRREMLEKSLNNQNNTVDPFSWEEKYAVRSSSCPPLTIENNNNNSTKQIKANPNNTTNNNNNVFANTAYVLQEKQTIIMKELDQMKREKSFMATLKYLDFLWCISKRNLAIGGTNPTQNTNSKEVPLLAVDHTIQDCREIMFQYRSPNKEDNHNSDSTIQEEQMEFKAAVERNFETNLLSNFSVQSILQKIALLFYINSKNYKIFMSQTYEKFNNYYDYEGIFRTIDKTIKGKEVSNAITVRVTLHGVRRVPLQSMSSNTAGLLPVIHNNNNNNTSANSAGEYYITIKAEKLLIHSSPVSPDDNHNHNETNNNNSSNSKNVSFYGQTFTIHLYDSNSIMYFFLSQKPVGVAISAADHSGDNHGNNNKIAEGGFHVQSNNSSKSKTHLWLPLKGKNCYKTELKLTIEIL